MIFIDWDYDKNIATKYERTGECNRCGDCCYMHIGIQVANNDGDISAQDSGGDTTDGSGRWSEVGDKDEDREFVRFKPRPEVKRRACSTLLRDENACSLNGDKPWCCTVFPTAPSDIAALENCSYEFIELDKWEID